jgi:predicted metal-dependent hydrolase
MHSKKIKLPGVGDILLERSPRAKYLNLSVKPFKGARIAVPQSMPFELAATFARSKAGWIKTRLKSMAQMERTALVLRHVVPFDAGKARKQLVDRIETLAAAHGFSYRRVFIRNQKTRWGSCSHQNNINLNINLVLLPSELMDYIILHELVHTRVKNHGPEFWQELEKCIQNARMIDRKLDQYRALLADGHNKT